MSLAAAANLAWWGLSRAPARRFAAALERVEPTQEALLDRCLRRNRDTVFGRRHGFAAIRSFEEYQRRVPVTTWDDYRPYIDRLCAGEAAVLTRDPVRFFELSSGSSAAAKKIPFTASFQAELRRAVAPWIAGLFARRPELALGPAYWSVTPALSTTPGPSAAPVGAPSDGAYLGGIHRRLVEAVLAVPGAVAAGGDAQGFRRRTLLHLLRCRELRLISVWHPSFLELLLDELRQTWEELLDALAGGSPPDPARARELAAFDPGELRRIWPRLGLVSAWGDGPAAAPLAALTRRLEGIEVEPKGLLATEAFVTVPFRGKRPLAVTSHVFELLEPDGVARRPSEVEVGGEYSVVVTTGAGLYRYRLGDRVRVTGLEGGCPCLAFLGKEDQISDLCGEKLSEGFVARATGNALADCGLRPAFALLAPEIDGEVRRYVLFFEADHPPPGRLATALDASLADNPHYALCRRLGQLAHVDVVPVAAGAYRRYAARLVDHGQRLGDVKPSALSPIGGWRDALAPVTTPPLRARERRPP